MRRAATPPSGRKVRSPSILASGQALRGWDRMRTTRPRHRRECDPLRHVLAVTLLQVSSAFGHGVGLCGLTLDGTTYLLHGLAFLASCPTVT
jgi:hypothetical protein